MSEKVINVGFIGNPNCGKTTLFNAYTGANLKVANWPGVTVEKKEGRTTYKGQEFKLIDPARDLQSDFLHHGRKSVQRVYHER